MSKLLFSFSSLVLIKINKALVQDILLPFVEEGIIYLIGCTTANPFISINKAIRSRCHLLEVKPLTNENIVEGLKRAIKNKYGFNNNLKKLILII